MMFFFIGKYFAWEFERGMPVNFFSDEFYLYMWCAALIAFVLGAMVIIAAHPAPARERSEWAGAGCAIGTCL